MTYTYIRLTEKITLPAATTSFALDSDRVIVYDGSRRPTDAPDGVYTFALEGEPAEAVRAFLGSSISFPVTSNGILDIPKGWTDRTVNIPYPPPKQNMPLGGVLTEIGAEAGTIKATPFPYPPHSLSNTFDGKEIIGKPNPQSISLDKITERLKQK